MHLRIIALASSTQHCVLAHAFNASKKRSAPRHPKELLDADLSVVLHHAAWMSSFVDDSMDI